MNKIIFATLLLVSSTVMAQTQYRPYTGSSTYEQQGQQLQYDNALRQQTQQQYQNQQQLQQQQNQYNQQQYQQRQLDNQTNQWMKPKY